MYRVKYIRYFKIQQPRDNVYRKYEETVTQEQLTALQNDKYVRILEQEVVA
ncbi:hypothetical protein [Metabacillus sp. RGM 3146]|uniref:hypothetical protein n=1 Tax=Metabacillus sp. RGM 3146 TaxID=3401092 RepID=UPI003B9CD77B